MKKAKIMLMAIAIVGVVGGALAFKTAKFTGKLFVCTTTVSGGSAVCTGGFQTSIVGTTTLTTYTATTASSVGGTCYNSQLSFYCKTAAGLTSVPVIAAAGE